MVKVLGLQVRSERAVRPARYLILIDPQMAALVLVSQALHVEYV